MSTNLTLVIDEDLLRAARVKALQEGTSVNEICRQAIARYAGPVDTGESFARQLRGLSSKLSRQAKAQPKVAQEGRDAMYDEAMAERSPTLWAALGQAEVVKVTRSK